MPDDDKAPIGERFSHVYVQRGEPTQDSPRMRRRLAELLKDFPDLDDFGETLPRKLGIDPRRRGYVNWPEFCAECELQDLLDTITLGGVTELVEQYCFSLADWINGIVRRLRVGPPTIELRCVNWFTSDS